jgi:hypothetical protein
VVSNHAARLLDDHQYLVGASSAALRTSPGELEAAWLHVVDRAHEELR